MSAHQGSAQQSVAALRCCGVALRDFEKCVALLRVALREFEKCVARCVLRDFKKCVALLRRCVAEFSYNDHVRSLVKIGTNLPAPCSRVLW